MFVMLLIYLCGVSDVVDILSVVVHWKLLCDVVHVLSVVLP